MKFLQTALVVVFVFCFSCDPLPRPSVFEGSIGILPVSSAATGLILITSDSSYTSSDVYFYDFSTGQLRSLANGESGDVIAKWDRGRLWLFNRSNGRVSYSHFSPKMGPESRSVEKRTPDGLAGDPSELVSLTEISLALGLGSAHKVVIANLLSGAGTVADLGKVDTGDVTVPFRPGVLISQGGELWAFHQQLTENWKAAGGGKIFISRISSSGSWVWVDQNPVVAETQGVMLNVSNPVSVFNCNSTSCLIAGACYSTMGASCVAGVDDYNSSVKTVRHLFDMPTGYASAGPIRQGVTTDSYSACVKASEKANAEIVSMSLNTGVIQKSWDTGTSFCGVFQVDPSASRIFAIKNTNRGSEFHVLNSDLSSVSMTNLPFVVTGMEIVNE